MAKFLVVFKLRLLGQSLICLDQVMPSALNLVFLALKFLHVDFVWVVLFAEPAISLSDWLRVK